jgi:hypothetical protein
MAPSIAPFPMLIILLVVVIPLLVLFIRLCIKKSQIAAIVALVPLILVLSLFLIRLSNYGRLEAHRNRAILKYQDILRKYEILNNGSVNQAPIWSEGIDQQFEADVYPSGISALRALARQVIKQIPYVMGESGSLETIVIYSDSQAVNIIEEFRQAISKLIPEIKCRIEIGNIELNPNEMGIRYSLETGDPANPMTYNDRMQVKGNMTILKIEGESGTIQARIFCGPRQSIVSTKYNNKTWVENFSDFVNIQPDKQYIVAKSSESCLAPGEAEQQAMEDACVQASGMLKDYSRQTSEYNLVNNLKASPADIQESGMVIDKFVQSFDGSAGKIWRQAILLDVSPEKLNQLADKIAGITQVRRQRRLSTVGSIAGLFVLITIVYIFLNAATKGYYAWSLRIVGVVLALILIFLLFA